MSYELTVNGCRERVDLPPLASLAVALRECLGLIGTKVGCGEGWCGSCAVLVDGAPACACLYPVGLASGRSIVTIEGLSPRDGGLSELQQALLENGAVQCGACTPGLVVMLTALLAEGRPIGEGDVRDQLSGTVCRCSCYRKAIDATLEQSPGG